MNNNQEILNRYNNDHFIKVLNYQLNKIYQNATIEKCILKNGKIMKPVYDKKSRYMMNKIQNILKDYIKSNYFNLKENKNAGSL
jgi:hypothetical protein